MTEPDPTLLSKATSPTASAERVASRGLPPVLLRLAVRRVQVVALVVLIAMLLGWVLGNLIEGEFGAEFQRVGEWWPPVFMIGTSVVMIVLARWTRMPPETLVNAALVYEVAVSFAIAFSTYWDTFTGMPVILMETDVVGFQFVALWMLMFTVLVPSQPRRALVALLLSATAIPVVYVLEVHAGRAPYLGPVDLWLVFIGPYFGVAGLAYISAKVIYRLGQDVSRAREMGSYRLVEKLGQGGMGEVWRARHRMLARPAAVKLIHAHALGTDPARAAEFVARFEREAQATALLQSPHTVEVYDFGTTEDGSFYYVMELLEGIDLDQLVRRFGPLPPERVIYVLRQVCASLAEAHHCGMVHRDIKPANTYLCRRGLEDDFVKVLDFGLVKHRTSPADGKDLHLSRTGIVHGTPSYLAPEVASGEGAVDGRADLYAVGCVAYWLLTGRRVFEKDGYPAMLLAHATLAPSPPSTHAPQPVPPALDAVVLACLAKEPADRVQSAEELMTQLAAVPVATPWTQTRAAEWWRDHVPPVTAAPTGRSATRGLS
ncbi:MAG: protein kinase [Gemmatimonadota bacterium]|nr:protein kinase [Gemmatimonadota bacterium]